MNSLKRAFEPLTEERRRLATRQFAARNLQPGEDIEVFLRDLERLLDRAQPGLQQELREQQLVDRFIVGLPVSIGDQLYVLSPQGLNGTVSKARELMPLQATQRATTGSRRCRSGSCYRSSKYECSVAVCGAQCSEFSGNADQMPEKARGSSRRE
jgi:hypothetical protein